MKKGGIYLVFLLLALPLFAQQNKTAIDYLKAGEIIEIDWVHQQYLSDSGSVAGDYPLFPDQLQDGEGEMHARLKIEALSENQIKIWVAYIFTLQYPKRVPIDFSKGLYARGLPDEALVYPVIEDTRYHFETGTLMPDFYKNLNKTPLIFDVNKGIINKEWFNSVEEALKKTPVYFNAYHLEAFLVDFLSASFTKKVNYQKTIQYQQVDKLSQHYYQPNLPPKKTVITGVIKNPISNKVGLNYSNHESWVKRPWGGNEIELDSTGHFIFEFFLKTPSNPTLQLSFFPMPIYVEPSDSIHLEIDGNGIYRRTKFSGSNAVNNQVLLDFYHHIRGDTIMMITPDRSIQKKSQTEYLREMQQKEVKELDYLIHQKNKVSPNFYSFLDRTIRFSNANRLWYNASFFKRRPNIHLLPSYIAHCQKSSRLLYRLPSNKEFDFKPGMYLEFQKTILKGVFLNQRFPFRSLQTFEFEKQLLTPDNAFRYGQLLLFFNREKSSTTAFQHFYKNFEAACSQTAHQQTLIDYLAPKKSKDLLSDNAIRILPLGKQAPFWKYPMLDGQKQSINDFAGKYLLLHIGLEQNLPIALEDIEEIKTITNKPIDALSIVARQSGIPVKRNSTNIIYLPHEEMQILRDSYAINNNANNYFIIDPNGKVLSNPLFTGTFNHLKSSVADLPLEKETWQPTPIFWRNLGISAFLLLLLGGVYAQRKRTLAKKEQQKRQLVELELKGIRAQMNPHFLFNALSSIQNLIRKKEEVAADRYLTQFAGLVRKILRNSEQEFITLEEEMAAIKQYCSLEALRTPFDYKLNIAADIDGFNTYIPGMLIQPLVENAILHGLMPQQGERNLWINIKPHPKGLACEIIDNGIGIQKAQGQKQRHKAHQKSFGMVLIRQRLGLLLNQPESTFLTMQDRSKLTPPATGTIVNLIIPIEQ